MRVRAKHLVDKVDDVGPHHGNFIDDDEFDVLNKFPVVGRIFQKIFQFSPLKLRIIGQERMKRKLEKLCRVLPPALIAAIPVGASTTYFFWYAGRRISEM